ncbi:hypothetical protein P7K49_032262 [Saguinus oedipus]|uniref:Uncharacterized protein n=1 Tax=Saguinus oedipus TaxID=9490 RepID=A0ABQ9TXR4_SAGOE|nr:hypothetical protein P7K49_032262 [Saguinus oedipus]
MRKGKGRTSRVRRRKLCRSSESRGVNESYKSEFIELRKWLKDRKFQDLNLVPARFPEPGKQQGQLLQVASADTAPQLVYSCAPLGLEEEPPMCGQLIAEQNRSLGMEGETSGSWWGINPDAEITMVTVLQPESWLTGKELDLTYPAELNRSCRAYVMGYLIREGRMSAGFVGT